MKKLIAGVFGGSTLGAILAQRFIVNSGLIGSESALITLLFVFVGATLFGLAAILLDSMGEQDE